ncbi:MAG: toprim domain-containing protein, partial [bacterium]|nr:toprim domain-containing protein [bacterium]
LYDKSRILYGLDKSKNQIREKESCFLVEGQMDLLMAWQDGVKNICATSGTALTTDHLNILKRYTENLILGFDMDEAGETATNRGIDLAVAAGFNIKIVSLPEGKPGSRNEVSLPGKDPADFVKENQGELTKILETAQPIMDYYFSRVFQKYNPQNLEEKKKIAALLLPQIKKIYNKIEQAHWLDELSRRLNTPAQYLSEELKKIKPDQNYSPDELIRKSNPAASRRDLLAERLMTLILRSPENKIHLAGLEAVLPAPFVPLCENLKSCADPFHFETFYQKLPLDIRRLADYLALKADFETELNPEINFQKEIYQTVIELNIQKKDEDLKKLEAELKDAQNCGDAQRLEALLKEFQEVSSQKQNLKRIYEKNKTPAGGEKPARQKI